MIKNNISKTAIKRQYWRVVIVAASFLLIIGLVGIAIMFNFNRMSKSGGSGDGNVVSGGSGGRVCEMFLVDGSMYYTDYKDTLFRYINSTGEGIKVSNIEIASGAPVFESHGYIYYSNGSGIFQRNMTTNDSVQLKKGENISVKAVNDGRIFYHIAYKDSKGNGFSEFENRIYEIESGKDKILFDRSSDMWHLLAVNENTLIADATVGNEYGLFAVDLASGERKRLSSYRAFDGCLIGDMYYFTAEDEKGLWSVNINGGESNKLTLPGMNSENFFVDRITGYGDFLYVAAYYEGENHVIRMDLKTKETSILRQGLGRVWKLRTDGRTLYAYDTKSPADMNGNITVITLD